MNEAQLKMTPDGRLNTDDAAEYLGLTVKTLAMWRSNGVGPQFIKLGGKIFYYLNDLKDYVDSSVKLSSTAQARLQSKSQPVMVAQG